MSNLNIVEETITFPYDLLGRKAHPLVYKIGNFKSNIYFSTIDNSPINAKSLLGLLSIHIQKGTLVRIACHCENKDTAESDFKFVLKSINELAVSDNE